MGTPVLDLFRPLVLRLCRAYFALELHGTGHIPPTGAVIITPNHQTYADPTLVTIPVRRPVYYMAWNRLFDVPGLAWLIRRLRAFPVDLEGRSPGAAREAMRLLHEGQALMIFPEGRRSPSGAVLPFRPGAFRLAAALDVPVLPVTVAGGDRAWPPGQLLPRPGRVRIVYHAPLHPDRSLGPRAAATELADRTRAVIAGALVDQVTRSSTR